MAAKAARSVAFGSGAFRFRANAHGSHRRRRPAAAAKPAAGAKPAASARSSSAGPAALAPTQCSTLAPKKCSSEILIDDIASHAKEVDSEELVTWLCAIIQGRQITVKTKTHKFKPLLKSGLNIKVTKSFDLKHGKIMRRMKRLARAPGSNLTLTLGAAKGISNKSDLVQWMLRHRREA